MQHSIFQSYSVCVSISFHPSISPPSPSPPLSPPLPLLSLPLSTLSFSFLYYYIDDSLELWDQSILYLAFFGLWVLSAIISTSYTFSWDILMDWSLFPNIPQRCCRKNALTLRQDRIYSIHTKYVTVVNPFLDYMCTY